MKEQMVFDDRFDIAGNGILRFIKHLLVNRMMLLGNLFNNPGARCLIILVVLHYFGGPIYWIFTRWERPIRFLLTRIRQIK